jgi:MFS family permease
MAGRFVSSRVLRAVGPSKLVLMSVVLALAAAVLLGAAPSAVPAAAGAVLIGLGFAAIYPTTLAVVGEKFAAFTGTAFSVVIAVGLAGRIARWAGLRQGLFLPVVNCAMIIVLQILIGRAVKRRRAAA